MTRILSLPGLHSLTSLAGSSPGRSLPPRSTLPHLLSPHPPPWLPGSHVSCRQSPFGLLGAILPSRPGCPFSMSQSPVAGRHCPGGHSPSQNPLSPPPCSLGPQGGAPHPCCCLGPSSPPSALPYSPGTMWDGEPPNTMSSPRISDGKGKK